jgi:hypothetical protein
MEHIADAHLNLTWYRNAPRSGLRRRYKTHWMSTLSGRHARLHAVKTIIKMAHPTYATVVRLGYGPTGHTQLHTPFSLYLPLRPTRASAPAVGCSLDDDPVRAIRALDGRVAPRDMPPVTPPLAAPPPVTSTQAASPPGTPLLATHSMITLSGRYARLMAV